MRIRKKELNNIVNKITYNENVRLYIISLINLDIVRKYIQISLLKLIDRIIKIIVVDILLLLSIY